MSQPVQPIRLLIAGAIFVLTWLLWSGIYTPLLILLGLFSCGVVLWFAKRAGFFDTDVYSLHLSHRLPAYWGWLALEIVKSNLVVARIVLKRNMPISPILVKVDASKFTPVGQAILGNAITLTPATLSFDVAEGVIHVHCLTESSAAALDEGEMARRLLKLTGH